MASQDGLQPRRRSRSRRPPPGTEQIDIRTVDGWSLRTDVHEPATEPPGTAVLAHASAARRSEFDRPPGRGLAHFLFERGWRVVAFDFRGHGDSTGPAAHGDAYGYDDFVTRDLPAVHAFARSRAGQGEPLVLVGHSLGGHVGLAAQGAGHCAFDGIVGVGAAVWLRALEPSSLRWLLMRAALSAGVALSRRLGRFPARALRIGSDDEARGYVEDFERFARTGRWGSRDGRVDYLEALGAVRVPVLHIVSEGDRFECPPTRGARFIARCGGPRETIVVSRSDDGSPPPDHMGLVTSAAARRPWERAEEWMRRLRPGRPRASRAPGDLAGGSEPSA